MPEVVKPRSLTSPREKLNKIGAGPSEKKWMMGVRMPQLESYRVLGDWMTRRIVGAAKSSTRIDTLREFLESLHKLDLVSMQPKGNLSFLAARWLRRRSDHPRAAKAGDVLCAVTVLREHRIGVLAHLVRRVLN